MSHPFLECGRSVGVPVLCHHGHQLGWFILDERILHKATRAVHFPAVGLDVPLEEKWGPRPPRWLRRAGAVVVTMYLEQFVTPATRVMVHAEFESDVEVGVEMVMPEERRLVFRAGPVEQVLLPNITAFRPLQPPPRYL